MSNSKLTDSEIVKALNKCSNISCCECPLCNDPCDIDHGGVPTFIIDLINCLEARIGVYETCNARKDEAIKHLESEVKRLQAEKQILEIELKAMRGAANGFKADNERLQAECGKGANALIKLMIKNRTAKIEAYKEFAERLNKIEKFRSCVESDNYELSVTMREVDNVLKEMVGEDNV
jgi:prefoldin subunit 5